ncbi:MAG: S41 family peptidase, partial [Planctomycetota bacterium]
MSVSVHRSLRFVVLALAACLAWGPPAAAEVTPHGGMLRHPDVGRTHIVFVYANDIWTVPREGGLASPLASPPGAESRPRFSADEETIAFVGNYDGGRDIYTVPTAGGLPHRVTYHPAGEMLCDWTSDGELLFFANGQAGLRRQSQVFLVPPSGGLPRRLPMPYGTFGSLHANGHLLVYTPETRDTRSWKRYRGGRATDLWLFDLETLNSRKLTDWEGTDTQPMWGGDRIYYLSDAGSAHRMNLWVFDPATGAHRQITRFTDHDVRWPSMGPGSDGQGEIVFQHGSRLHLLDLSTEETRPVDVRIPGARPTLRPQSVDAAKYIAAWGFSPSGKRAVVEARGDIWTLPARHGMPRNLTRTSGAAERSPAWSPDGRWIAYFSDAAGEYDLYLRQSDGKGETRRITRDATSFRFLPTWSPDSERIAFTDKAGVIYVHELALERTMTVDQHPRAGWRGAGPFSWSHDGRYLAYSRSTDAALNESIFIWDVRTGESRQVTSDMFEDVAPTFDRKGDYLFFRSARSFRPQYSDVDSTFIYRGSEVLVVVPLRADQASPFLPESDEEAFDEGEEEEDGEEPAEDEGSETGEEDAEPTEAPEDDGLSGTWEGTARDGEMLPPEGVTFTIVLSLDADGSVTGGISLPMGSATITEGSFDPATGALVLVLEDEMGVEWKIEAVVEGDTVTGTASALALGMRVEFDGKRTSRDRPSEPAGESTPERKPARDEVQIDFDGFEARAIQLPVPAGNFGRLAVNHKGHLIYARRPPRRSGEEPSIHLFDLEDEKRQEKDVASGASDFLLSADGKRLLVVRGTTGTIQPASAGSSGKPVVTAGMTVWIDPRAEWQQILRDAWRIERDYFYDPHMHGVDWDAAYEHYAAMLPDCVTRDDVGILIRELIGELNVGHAYYRSGPSWESVAEQDVGLLGVDYELHEGAYRIAKIHRGADWDLDARGPLGVPGVDVEEGDYLLAVNGVPVDTSKAPWAAFLGLSGKTVYVTVSEKPALDEDARDVLVRPIGSEATLRYRSWIERNRALVQ